MYYQKSTQYSEKHVLEVSLGPLSNAIVRFFLSVHFDPFCKTVIKAKPHIVKNEKMTLLNEISIDGGQKFQHGGFFGRSFQCRCPVFPICSF